MGDNLCGLVDRAVAELFGPGSHKPSGTNRKHYLGSGLLRRLCHCRPWQVSGVKTSL